MPRQMRAIGIDHVDIEQAAQVAAFLDLLHARFELRRVCVHCPKGFAAGEGRAFGVCQHGGAHPGKLAPDALYTLSKGTPDGFIHLDSPGDVHREGDQRRAMLKPEGLLPGSTCVPGLKHVCHGHRAIHRDAK